MPGCGSLRALIDSVPPPLHPWVSVLFSPLKSLCMRGMEGGGRRVEKKKEEEKEDGGRVLVRWTRGWEKPQGRSLRRVMLRGPPRAQVFVGVPGALVPAHFLSRPSPVPPRTPLCPTPPPPLSPSAPPWPVPSLHPPTVLLAFPQDVLPTPSPVVFPPYPPGNHDNPFLLQCSCPCASHESETGRALPTPVAPRTRRQRQPEAGAWLRGGAEKAWGNLGGRPEDPGGRERRGGAQAGEALVLGFPLPSLLSSVPAPDPLATCESLVLGPRAQGSR